MRIRRAKDRGHFDHGWLDTWHTFSFADYEDPRWMGFRTLRVINEDRVMGGEGFGTHGHRDMEIITYVLEGALEHRDSTGGRGVIKAGECQRMTAGSGVMHSELNASPAEPCRLYQIWILPEKRNLTPGYEQQSFTERLAKQDAVLVASPDARDGSMRIHQDCEVWLWKLGAGEQRSLELPDGKGAWVQVVSGEISIGNEALAISDAAALDASTIIFAAKPSELLIFILK